MTHTLHASGLTVVETPKFVARAKRHLTDEQRKDLIDLIALAPRSGNLMPGTGG